jgi:ATP-dependent helicase HrpA
LETRRQVHCLAAVAWRPQPALGDIRGRLARLAGPDALVRVPLADVPTLVRFVDGLAVRIRRLAGPGLDRDRANQALVRHWEDELARAEAQLALEGRDPGILEPFRRLVEEYHVSLFAQELRTAVPVSAERLARAWQGGRRATVPGLLAESTDPKLAGPGIPG